MSPRDALANTSEVTPATSRKAIDGADVALSEGLRIALARRRPLRRLAILAARSVDFWVCVLVLLPLWWLGAPPLARNAVHLLLGTTAAGIIVRGMKQLVRRERPASDWGGSYRRGDQHSYPSGHAARVGFIATVGGLAVAVL